MTPELLTAALLLVGLALGYGCVWLWQVVRLLWRVMEMLDALHHAVERVAVALEMQRR